ncbi:hypothetical protein [Vibrio hepatarius]|uniref:hypothetical protein n=1 Tax=Vibrio hepatarius TaxID=171383 RepID=UPI00148C0CEE|nr:hypothetical protein [Vibrio hepatarius]NOI15876.1 hypothetical protein [Vibrio hepatarius]
MKILRCLFLLSAVSITAGCSTLNSSSDFSDAVQSIKERSNYVEVAAKTIIPDTQALVGANLVRSELTYTSVQPIGESNLTKKSTIDMTVTFFKSYDVFHSASVLGQTVALDNSKPMAETCSEHCTVTQWVSFPFSERELAEFSGENVNFTITSGNNNIVEVSVPKAYFEAIEQEADTLIARNQSTQPYVNQTPEVIKVNDSAPASKALEMTQYWYAKASAQDIDKFSQFAISNRKGVVQKLESTSQELNMMQYWYSEASEIERSQILQWLISQ